MVQFLTNEKDDFNAEGNYEKIVLCMPALTSKLEIVKSLINEEAVDFNATDNNVMTVLHMVTANHDNSSKTDLHTAAVSGNLEMVKFLINERKANFNAKDNDGRTVLYIADVCGHVFEFLKNIEIVAPWRSFSIVS
nr:uncharacterized protein LOC117220627 [Megalopta genalis]